MRARKAPKPLEREVLNQCRDYLRLMGYLVCRINSGGTRATHKGKKRFIQFNDTPGVSDLACVAPGGVAVFVEVKRPGGKATAAQASFLDEVRRRGGVAILADSVESLARQLEEAGL